ncbi:MAG: hypothetical protein KF872_06100 [Chitinophagales bacterium]|nr:hypothetical protein [Chitinophagales bacterium]
MENLLTKEIIHNRLKELGISITDASRKMNMTRQNFNRHLGNEPISRSFTLLFKDVFGLENKVSIVKEEQEKYHANPGKIERHEKTENELKDEIIERQHLLITLLQNKIKEYEAMERAFRQTSNND